MAMLEDTTYMNRSELLKFNRHLIGIIRKLVELNEELDEEINKSNARILFLLNEIRHNMECQN